MSRRRIGFTLIELLAVVTIIAVLISILLPSLAKARSQVRRTVCASNLSQIGKAWQMYAANHQGALLRLTISDGGANAHLLYGGKPSLLGPERYARPLNREMNIPVGATTGFGVYHCPSDLRGGRPELETNAANHFDEWGTSYVMNWLLIGQFCPTNLAKPIRDLLCKKLPSRSFEQRNGRPDPKVVKIEQVYQPGRTLLGGDAGWRFMWGPREDLRLEWHDKTDSHNLLFVDGSVRFIRMKSRSGRTKDYTVYPFRDVNEFFDKR